MTCYIEQWNCIEMKEFASVIVALCYALHINKYDFQFGYNSTKGYSGF